MLKLGINGGLQSLLSTQTFNFILQHTTSYSTSSNSTPTLLAEYLVNSLGFSKKQALLTSSKVTHFNSTHNPDSVVGFFHKCGFSQAQIKKLVSGSPKILSFNVDKTLKPKIKAFQDFGLCDSDIAHVIATSPHVLLMGLHNVILPTLDILKSIFHAKKFNEKSYVNVNDGDDDVSKNLLLIKTMKKSCWLLAPNIHKELPLAVSLLQSYGLSLERIRDLLARKPRCFSLSSKWWKAVLVRVEKLGIPQCSPMFYHGVCALSSLSEESLKVKMDLFRSYGFSELDLMTLTRRNPFALSISVAKLKSCIDLYTKELGIDPATIASRAFLLNLSLEKRTLPRHVVLKGLKEKGVKINCSIVTCLSMTESEFLSKYVEPLKDKVPNQYDVYMKSVHPP